MPRLGLTRAWYLVAILALGCRSVIGHPSVAPVTVGADRLLPEFGHLVRGKRVAVVANHSARLQDGRHLVDALAADAQVRLAVLFGMEYDIRSNDYSAPRDPDVAVDRATGLPKYNLYGEHHKPSPESLRNVDVVVFDIQEVGARFYEHVNILAFVMEAAAESGARVVVLDRPNPIGGVAVQGFVTDPDRQYRFGSYARIPVVHGMTVGELARMYNGERMLRGARTVALDVIPMRGWRRELMYDATGLPWRKPSPNLLTFSSLRAYIGTCLFEAVNVSEGRGSDAPFERIGAPWLDATAVVGLLNDLRLPGVRFEAAGFTPVQQPFHGRPPEYANVPLQGVRLHITDAARWQPWTTGVAMLWAVHRRHREQLVWNDAVLDRLVATPRLKVMLEAGRTPAEIAAAWADELTAFQQLRRRYLLY